MDFEEAIQRHTAWKVRFRMAIFRKEHLDAATIAKDDCCPIGQWLHGPGQENAGSLPEFAVAFTAHRAFHVAAGKIAECINAGHYAQAEQAMADKSAYAEHSRKVTEALAALGRAVTA